MATPHLTKREDEIRRLVLDGLTNDAIGAELGISARTVEAHLRMLFRKTGASRRDQLAATPAAGPPAAERTDRGPSGDDEVIDRLERRLAERDRQVSSYETAVNRLADRQFPLFDERVEISLTVGSRPGEDMVVERHWTTPNPYVIYRVLRPITPEHQPYAEVAAALAMTYDVVDADVDVSVDVVPDKHGRPLVMLLFQPGLQEATEWVLRYRTPGLWDPLRERGRDALEWAAGTLDGRHAVGLGDMVLKVEFPPGAEAGLVEHRGVGDIETMPDDPTSVVFRDSSRTGGTYRWELWMKPGR